MQPLNKYSASTARINIILWCLGITRNYQGYHYAVCAANLCLQQPESLLLITKILYPDIAKQYKTNWKCVERDLRTVIDIAWKHNPELLSQLAGYKLEKRPCCKQFVSILAGMPELYEKEHAEL